MGLDNVSVTGVVAPAPFQVTLDGLKLRFPAEAGRSYVIEGRPEMAAGEWVAVPGSTRVGTGAALEVNLPLPGDPPQQFYRVRRLP